MLDMVGSDISRIVFAPTEATNRNTVSEIDLPVCILPPSTDVADTWNMDFNMPVGASLSDTRPTNLSFNFCRQKFYYYERHSFSLMGGMDSLVQACKDRIHRITACTPCTISRH